MTAHCHKMIRSVAQACAGELYEVLMGDDVMYASWKKANPGLTVKQLETRFVAKHWGRCVPAARATLALMLRNGVDTATGEAIMEALTLDSTLMRGRARLEFRQ